MPPEITRLVERFLKDPQRIEVAKQATTASTITQRFCRTPSDPKAKRSVLRALIRSQPVKNAIIFCNRKRDVAILHKSLVSHGFNAGALHGDMDQSARTATLDGFRGGQIAFLAASDVAARGLDIPDVSHVFNYDVPVHSDDYVHRIGRTGRAGKEGFSATLVTPEDAKMMRMIEKMVGVAPQWLEGIEPEPGALDGERDGGRRRERSGRDRGGRSRDRSGRDHDGGRGDRGPRRDDAVVAAAPEEIETLGGAGLDEDLGDPAARPEQRSDPSEDRRPDRGADRPQRPRGRDSDRSRGRSAGGRGKDRQEGETQPPAERPVDDGHRSRRSQESSPREAGSREGGQRHERRPEARGEPKQGARPVQGTDAPQAGRNDVRPQQRPEPRHEQRHDRHERNDRHDRSDKRGGRRDESPVLGLGDHVPEFLKRPVKISG